MLGGQNSQVDSYASKECFRTFSKVCIDIIPQMGLQVHSFCLPLLFPFSLPFSFYFLLQKISDIVNVERSKGWKGKKEIIAVLTKHYQSMARSRKQIQKDRKIGEVAS